MVRHWCQGPPDILTWGTLNKAESCNIVLIDNKNPTNLHINFNRKLFTLRDDYD